jgi:hypothetical protein
MKKETSHDSDNDEAGVKRLTSAVLPTYDCGGAIHIKFSLKREAINIVYKHNPIHTTREIDDRYVRSTHAIATECRFQLTPGSLPALATDNGVAPTIAATEEKKTGKRKRSERDEVEAEHNFRDPDMDMSTSPEAPRSSTKKKGKKNGGQASPTIARKTSTKKSKNAKSPALPNKSRKKALISEPSPPPIPLRGKACIRCRERKIKCNEAKPTCNQCQRGLWTCQYEILSNKKRPKNGCLNCKQRRRKCTEERPSCAHCLRLDDECEYSNYS